MRGEEWGEGMGGERMGGEERGLVGQHYVHIWVVMRFYSNKLTSTQVCKPSYVYKLYCMSDSGQ